MIPPDDHVALLADINARVGANHAAWPDIVGTALEAKLTAGAPEESRNLGQYWEYLKTALHDAAVESFGIKRPPRKDWMADNDDILEPPLSIKNKAHKDHINRPTRSTKTKQKEARCQFQKAVQTTIGTYSVTESSRPPTSGIYGICIVDLVRLLDPGLRRFFF